MRGRQGMKKKTMVKSYGMHKKGRKGMKKGKKKVAGAKSAKKKLTAKQKTLPKFLQKKIIGK